MSSNGTVGDARGDTELLVDLHFQAGQNIVDPQDDQEGADTSDEVSEWINAS